jgi:hypothetical protein
MNDLIRSIIIPQLSFEGANESEKFVKLFCDLYRIELFKDGLDLILTKMQEKHLRFEVKIIKGWDTNVGCFLTEKKSVYNQTFGKFFQKQSLKIILRSMHYNVLAHEMAHALEFEGGIDLGEEFRKCIGFDMKNRKADILTLRAEIQRLMVDALESYPENQFLSELFARYFELLSISRNVVTSGSFATLDVMGFFVNTTNFIEKIFNPKIRKKIDPKISQATIEIVKKVKLEAPQQKFQERVESRQKTSGGSFAKSVKSNAMWHNAWQKTKEIDDKK